MVAVVVASFPGVYTGLAAFAIALLLAGRVLATLTPQLQRLVGALVVALALSGAFAVSVHAAAKTASKPDVAKPTVVMVDPCSLYESGSLGWYLSWCFLP